jgi:hypothetical protein
LEEQLEQTGIKILIHGLLVIKMGIYRNRQSHNQKARDTSNTMDEFGTSSINSATGSILSRRITIPSDAPMSSSPPHVECFQIENVHQFNVKPMLTVERDFCS